MAALSIICGGWDVDDADLLLLEYLNRTENTALYDQGKFLRFHGYLVNVEHIHTLAREANEIFTPMSFVSRGLQMVTAGSTSPVYQHARMCERYEAAIARIDQEAVIAAKEMMTSSRCHKKTLVDVVADVRVIQYLIGYTYVEFCKLFEFCLPPLRKAFPKCPAVSSSSTPYASLLLKLFCFLWRCRTGTSYRGIQALTGTSHGQLCEEFIAIQYIVTAELSKLYPITSEENLKETGALFFETFTFSGRRFKVCSFFDNFYILLPRPGDDFMQESLYSGYKGAHCVKGLMVSKSLGMGILEVVLMYPGVADVTSTYNSRIYSIIEKTDLLGGGDKGYRSEAHHGNLITVCYILRL